MDGDNPEGDYSVGVLDVNAPSSHLRVWQTHFDTSFAREDINVVYPIDPLKELAHEGEDS
jgi:hypothetical protein